MPLRLAHEAQVAFVQVAHGRHEGAGARVRQQLAQFGQAAEEAAITMRGIREGNGIARSVIYGDAESQQVMANLNQMSRDLKDIVADLRRGKGTIGAVLTVVSPGTANLDLLNQLAAAQYANLP